MIRKSGNRFSEKIMLKQKDENMIRSNRIMFEIKTTEALPPGFAYASARRAFTSAISSSP
jgi:hypothetical protein